MTDALESHLQRQVEHSREFFWHRLRWRAVRKYLPESTNFELVDVGAGAGLLGVFLTRDVPLARYTFAEPIVSLRSALSATHGAAADLTDAPDFGSARVAVLLDVLEHQEDDRRFLAELVAKLQPGTTLLLTVPASMRLWSRWDVALGHMRRYDKLTLAACAEGLPLRIDELSYLFPELVPLGLWRARRSAASAAPVGPDEAEFPDLPPVLNRVLYGLGTVSLAAKRWWPIGTSVFLAATVTS